MDSERLGAGVGGKDWPLCVSCGLCQGEGQSPLDLTRTNLLLLGPPRVGMLVHLMFSQRSLEKVMAPHSSTLAWKVPWTEEPGRVQSMGSLRVGHDRAITLTFHFHALEKEMATHSSALAWKIPWMEEPGRLQPMGRSRVRHD